VRKSMSPMKDLKTKKKKIQWSIMKKNEVSSEIFWKGWCFQWNIVKRTMFPMRHCEKEEVPNEILRKRTMFPMKHVEKDSFPMKSCEKRRCLQWNLLKRMIFQTNDCEKDDVSNETSWKRRFPDEVLWTRWCFEWRMKHREKDDFPMTYCEKDDVSNDSLWKRRCFQWNRAIFRWSLVNKNDVSNEILWTTAIFHLTYGGKKKTFPVNCCEQLCLIGSFCFCVLRSFPFLLVVCVFLLFCIT
jgi:hypothetical protein